MRTFGILALSAILGYAVGVAVGYALVMTCSPNRHDKKLEAATTGGLMTGPLAAILALAAAWIWIV